MTELLSLTAQVLRSPKALVEGADSARFAQLAPRLLLLTTLGGAIFGGVVGSYRGGLQTLFAALKMPALLLIPVLVAVPAIRALYISAELEIPRQRIGLAALVGMARTAILAAALAPILWLYWSLSPGYHLAVLSLAGALGLVGIPGLATVSAVLPAGGRRRWLAAAASSLVLGLVTAQTGWLLRPFIARPTGEVVFLRSMEADVFSSLGATQRSAKGDYRQDWQPEREGATTLGENP